MNAPTVEQFLDILETTVKGGGKVENKSTSANEISFWVSVCGTSLKVKHFSSLLPSVYAQIDQFETQIVKVYSVDRFSYFANLMWFIQINFHIACALCFFLVSFFSVFVFQFFCVELFPTEHGNCVQISNFIKKNWRGKFLINWYLKCITYSIFFLV